MYEYINYKDEKGGIYTFIEGGKGGVNVRSRC